ncbi:MAG: hypothetical protein EBZ49_11970, partial [Proteobacteria bacterium]|nr:hypothetical protein [Pseudomonadota bacterium]
MKVSQLHFIGMGLVSVLSFIGCTRNSVVAEVGSYKITKKEVSLRMKAMSVFSPQQNEKMSLEQLIRSYTLAEVMKNRGVKSFDASVEEEAKRIAETSKSNPKIAEVKKTFGRDEEAFMKLFVLPMMADRLAYLDGYLKDEGFHKKQKEKANSFLADAQKNPAAFE